MKTPPVQMLLLLHLTGIFTGDPRVSCGPSDIPEIPLDMAPNSFDDQYKGCEEEAKLRDPLHTDFAKNITYAKAWAMAEDRWRETSPSFSVPSNFMPESGIAILAYTLETPNVYLGFNGAVRGGGQSGRFYHSNFTFKSFHFLLTRAVQVLKPANPDCYQVYRGIRNIRFTVLDSQEFVRLGQFASSSTSRNTAWGFGHDTFFTIWTCLGVSIKKFSFYKEKEVLIPPYEKFRVVSSRKEGTTTFIELNTVGYHSKYNCEYQSAAGLSLSSDNAPRSFLLWGFLLTAVALGSPGLC